ncbi:MAG: alkaline phosphatase family protein, partial [Terriglobales bacterium]
EDLCLRMDQSLAALFQTVDQKVGLDNCLIVFTADRGVMAMPEFLKERGMPAGRIDPKVFKTLLDSSLKARLGKEDWVAEFEPPNLYLNLDAIERQKYRQPDVETVASQMAQAVPGIGDIFTGVQFLLNQLPAGPHVQQATKSYYLGRSGELYILPKAGYIFVGETNGTASGSPYNYDCHVPLLIMGGTVQSGRYGQPVSPADIAPTIAGVLGIDPPSLSEGRVISECLTTTGSARGFRTMAEPATETAINTGSSSRHHKE